MKEGEVLFKVKSAGEGDVDVLAPYDGLVDRVAVKQGDQVQAGVPLAVVQKNTYYTDLTYRKVKFNSLK